MIVCEGKVTEPKYFEEFKVLYNNSLVHITTIGGAGVPESVVERAIEERQRLLATARRTRDSFDFEFEVWAVFDRDSHPKLQVPNAITAAGRNNISVAFSNPCFEVWGLMHFECVAKPGHHHETQRELKRLLNGYCHQTNPVISPVQLKDRYADAVKNAERALKDRLADSQDAAADPSTTVFRLTERIRVTGRE